METNNRWLNDNKTRVDNIVRECTIYDAKGSYGGAIHLKWIIKLLSESAHEIFRLQKKIDFMNMPPELEVAKVVEEKQEVKKDEIM